jgi:cell division initiation protein
LKITPIDLRKQEFKKALKGYERHEVNAFLEMVANELEEFLREHAALTERIRDLDGKIGDYRQMERTLQETILNAQKTVDDLKKNAEKEAEVLLKNARVEAEGILSFEGLVQAQKRVLDAHQEREGITTRAREMPSLIGVFEKLE